MHVPKHIALIASLVVLFCAVIFFAKPAFESARNYIESNNGISSTLLLDKKSLTFNVGNKKIVAEVVSTHDELEKGLGGRPYLEDNTGMFFIFSKPDNYGIWMKGMTFPIDVLWLDKSLKIVHVVAGMDPRSYPNTVYRSPEQALYVLELSKGDFAASGLHLGDQLTLVER